jgi:hypothetical protein
MWTALRSQLAGGDAASEPKEEQSVQWVEDMIWTAGKPAEVGGKLPGGNKSEFLQQLMDAGEELRMDQEAAAVDRSPAVQEVAGSAGARMAGAAAWCIHATSTKGSALSSAGATGALSTMSTTGPPLAGTPDSPLVSGTPRGLTETMVRGVLKAGWEDGAKFNLLMSTGDMIENIASYMFSSTARVATMQTDVVQSNRTGVTSGNGSRQGGVVAQGAVNMFSNRPAFA